MSVNAAEISSRIRSAYNGTLVKSAQASQSFTCSFNEQYFSQGESSTTDYNGLAFTVTGRTNTQTITHLYDSNGNDVGYQTFNKSDYAQYALNPSSGNHTSTSTTSYDVSNNYYNEDFDIYSYVIPALNTDVVDLNKYYELVVFADTPSTSTGSCLASNCTFELCNDGKQHRIRTAYRTLVRASDILVSDTSGNFGLACEIHFKIRVTSPSVALTTITIPYEAALYEIGKSVFDANAGVTVSDPATQSALNEGNNIAQQGNSIAEQGNSIAQENSDTTKDTNNKITSFFGSFFDNLIGIFVPEAGFFSQWFSDLNDFMSDKLGFLWSPFDFFITFLNGVYSATGSSGITFPELTWIDGTVIIPQTTIDLNSIGGSDLNELRDMIYFATDIILLGAVIHQFYQKIKLVFEGGSD